MMMKRILREIETKMKAPTVKVETVTLTGRGI